MSDREAEGEWDQTKGKVREGIGRISGVVPSHAWFPSGRFLAG